MTARIVLANGALGSTQRAAINDNFTELFDPDYFVASRATNQSIPPSAWTVVKFDAPYANTTGVTMNTSTGEMTFPLGGSDDAFGTWMLSGIVAWDNSLANLQLHTRKIRIRSYILGSVYVEHATSDQLFDPAAGVSGALALSHHQVYAMPYLAPAVLTCKMYVEVWHNAKVAGSPVNIDIEPVGIEAPLIVGARLSNYS